MLPRCHQALSAREALADLAEFFGGAGFKVEAGAIDEGFALWAGADVDHEADPGAAIVFVVGAAVVAAGDLDLLEEFWAGAIVEVGDVGLHELLAAGTFQATKAVSVVISEERAIGGEEDRV